LQNGVCFDQIVKSIINWILKKKKKVYQRKHIKERQV